MIQRYAPKINTSKPPMTSYGVHPHPDFENGVRNQAVLEAVEQSSKTRAWVNVQSLLKEYKLI